MENKDTKPRSSDEIDFTQFFGWIGRGFTRVGNNIIYTLASFRNTFFNNRVYFTGIILLGLILGALYSELLKRKSYKSTMVLSCDYFNTETLKSSIEKLNMLCTEPEKEGLMEALKIDISTAQNILTFDAESFVSEEDVVEMELLKQQLDNVAPDKKEIVEKLVDKLKIENHKSFRISVIVFNPDIVKPLETALVNYFKNNSFIKSRIEVHRANLSSRKTKLLQESKKLDSLKIILYKSYAGAGDPKQSSNTIFLSEERLTDPINIFKEDLELNEEILEINRELHIQSDFEVVDGFTSFKQPESASLSQVLFFSFLISWAMGYLIIGIWRFDKYLASYPTKS